MSRKNETSNNSQFPADRDGPNALVESILVESYPQALELLYDRIDYERIGHAPYTSNHYRLDRMRQLLSLLGSPQNDYPILHVAGTKGKGTTATLICDALRACGLRTGLFTSPHLIRLEERIQFQGEPCSEKQLVALTNSVLNAAIALEAKGVGRPTFFELTTAMGFLHASQQSADCLVLEVGLGGRLDSTNVCTPVICLITSISLDHQAQLGSTIPEIAGEKAGIIKPGIPVVCTARDPEAREVIKMVAEQKQSTLHLIDRDFFVSWQPSDATGRSQQVANPPEVASRPTSPASTSPTSTSPTISNASPAPSESAYAVMPALDALAHINFHWSGLAATNPSNALLTQARLCSTRMLGRHQADNIAGALAAVDLLRGLGWKLPEAQVQAAIAKCTPPARLQIVSQQPLSIIDTAHNPASIAAAIHAIEEHFRDIPRVIVFASSRDKDYRRMLELLLPSCQHLVLTAYQNNPRAVAVAELISVVEELCLPTVQSAENLAERKNTCQIHHAATPMAAWNLAQSLLSGSQLILATGSFFLAAELLPTFTERFRP